MHARANINYRGFNIGRRRVAPDRPPPEQNTLNAGRARWMEFAIFRITREIPRRSDIKTQIMSNHITQYREISEKIISCDEKQYQNWNFNIHVQAVWDLFFALFNFYSFKRELQIDPYMYNYYKPTHNW